MLHQVLVGWVAASLGLFLASNVLRGVHLASFADAIWAGALLGILQWALQGPIFYLLGFGTLGLGFLFWFITRWISAAIVILIASKLSKRLEVQGFLTALVTAFIVAAMGALAHRLL